MTRRHFQIAALACLLALFATAGFAQTTAPAPQGQNQTPPPFGRRMGRRMGGRHGDKGEMRGERMGRGALRGLNLTDAQRQQMRDIEQRYAQSFRSHREEMRGLAEARRSGTALSSEQQARARQLREEMRANAERMRTEIQNILTPEQRQQLQQRRDEMKQRGDERKQRREEFRQRRQRNNPPPSGNANSGQ